jgi:hypothetical protein
MSTAIHTHQLATRPHRSAGYATVMVVVVLAALAVASVLASTQHAAPTAPPMLRSQAMEACKAFPHARFEFVGTTAAVRPRSVCDENRLLST